MKRTTFKQELGGLLGKESRESMESREVSWITSTDNPKGNAIWLNINKIKISTFSLLNQNLTVIDD